jgi:hypothetical protein
MMGGRPENAQAKRWLGLGNRCVPELVAIFNGTVALHHSAVIQSRGFRTEPASPASLVLDPRCGKGKVMKPIRLS